MVNTDNLRKWTQELRTTPRSQITGYLGNILDMKAGEPVIGNCCLGIGTELAGVRPVPPSDEEGYPLDLTDPAAIGENLYYGNEREFPPDEFFEWLGIPNTWGSDVQIDWPTGVDRLRDREGGIYAYAASALNDDLHLTFSQIADVLDYFGVRGG